ncbi:hypothetical protein QQF64_020787 [Cirrhinus molitorella]|uniref:Uncharacterized protein n=1 Tax=Cirrhinus molitorella TaxID=172907 RepID=A0ABR3LA63_9TELE
MQSWICTSTAGPDRAENHVSLSHARTHTQILPTPGEGERDRAEHHVTPFSRPPPTKHPLGPSGTERERERKRGKAKELNSDIGRDTE